MAQGGGGQIPSDNGIYILDTNGKYWIKDNWDISNNDNAVGVALISDLHPDGGFVIAPDEFKDYCFGQNILIPSIPELSSEDLAKNDFNGVNNTRCIYDYHNENNTWLDIEKNAIKVCYEYIFKNGEKGYLPSFGEVFLMYENKNEVEDALSTINGDSFISFSNLEYKLSSSQCNETKYWAYKQSDFLGNGAYKLDKDVRETGEARPCCKLK